MRGVGFVCFCFNEATLTSRVTSQLNRTLLGVTLGQSVYESHPKGSDALVTI